MGSLLTEYEINRPQNLKLFQFIASVEPQELICPHDNESNGFFLVFFFVNWTCNTFSFFSQPSFIYGFSERIVFANFIISWVVLHKFCPNHNVLWKRTLHWFTLKQISATFTKTTIFPSQVSVWPRSKWDHPCPALSPLLSLLSLSTPLSCLSSLWKHFLLTRLPNSTHVRM